MRDGPAPQPSTEATGGVSKRLLLIAVASAVLVAAVIGVAWQWLARDASRSSSHDVTTASFVGSETCAGCHRPEAELWRGSQHKHAMDHATDKSVLGDFSNASFDHYGVRSRFFRKDNKFFVETDGPDGKLGVFEIKYTFGIDPLQQYLIEFSDGRLQALSVAWDNRPAEKGGKRWYHLYPNEEIKHDDVLHWTRLNQNWNFMCAECHSTGVRKNYDAANDRFATSFSEISVGCEACHGKGSRHVEWAKAQQSWWPFGKHEDPRKGLVVLFDERRNVGWPINESTGNPARSVKPAALRKEVETCGLCHARRGGFSEDWAPGQPLSDTHLVSPIARGLYHADGQMLDEVYNYGPFKQSKMHAAGVTCGDCHEPHGAKLRIPGDGACLQCHASEKYTVASHHHHEAAKPPLPCASCHMPVRTYMGIDERHDHSFRVPRPDVSARLGTPNACNDCHKDKTAEWAAAAVERWHGPNRKGFQNYAQAFQGAWSGRNDAAALLGAIAGDARVPPYARASALTALRPYVSPTNINLARAGLGDSDPMVRIGALDMVEGVQPDQLWRLVSPLLSDPSRGVRIRAAALLAAVPAANQPVSDRKQFDAAAAELIAAQRLNADRPEARATLGTFFARRGQTADAEVELKAALRLSPNFAPAAINLADLYRQTGHDPDGERTLRAAIVASPQDAGLHHALGLALSRLKRVDEATAEFRRASELEPERARYLYVYAVALHSSGRGADALTALKQGLAKHPEDRDILLALVTFNRDSGDIGSALEYAERLERIAPNDRSLATLIETLRLMKKPDRQ